jgi:hypothetical protein
MDYLRRWVRNLFINLAVIAGVTIFMLIFVRIFYPETFSMLFLTGKAMIGMINVLSLWPLVILIAIINAMPRRRRSR